jgi:isoleucyl-tRNA synthetase
VLGLEQNLPEDLHKPYIDDVILVSDEGQKMIRESDLIDVWFDSGSMPYAQWHYPFENTEKFNENFPADFIAEGVDQTRGWFFTLHAIATMTQDSVAFKNVMSNGLVQDKLGRKMSKRLGNAAEPFETIAKYGADATRWYMISNAQPWDNLKFDEAGIGEVQRKFFGTLYNTYSFFALYANIDKFSNKEDQVPSSDRSEIDRWILSELHSLNAKVKSEFSNYEPTNATRLVMEFVDRQLSNWYVRLCRRRFWKGEYSNDKISAYQTLYECLVTVAKLMSPVAPFFAEWLYRNLNEITGMESHQSVHMCLFPESNENKIDADLERRMDYAQRISSLVLSLRRKESLRVRQPLQKILLPILDKNFESDVELVKELVLAEVNIKEIEYVDDTSGMLKKKAKPNFKTLGRRLGKNMKVVAGIINGFTQEDISTFESSGEYTLDIDGNQIVLSLEDIVITSEDIPGWQVANDGPITVALDISLTDKLIAEGNARELVNRIQNLRKSKDLNVTDRILIKIEDHQAIHSAIAEFGDYICQETLGDKILLSQDLKVDKINLLDGVDLSIDVEKV